MSASCEFYRERSGDWILLALSPAGRCWDILRLRRPAGVQAVLRPLRCMLRQRPNRRRVQAFFRSAEAWAVQRGEYGLG